MTADESEWNNRAAAPAPAGREERYYDQAETITRMARAIYDADGPFFPWAEAHSLCQNRYLTLATAALAAVNKGGM